MNRHASATRWLAALVSAAVALALSACATNGAGHRPGGAGTKLPAAGVPLVAHAPAPTSAAAAAAAGFPAYLPEGAGIESLAFLPPPPESGSAAAAHDEDVARRLLRLRGSARWSLAVEDANTEFPRVATTWSCALGVAVTPDGTPTLYRLLRRVQADSSRATRSAKDHYRRARPFVVNGQPTCTPQDDQRLAADGSYPSGHAARGWLWAMVVAEVAPDRAHAVMARGRAYGESRLVCNVHWRSDVLASRDLAAAVAMRLHESAEFRADVERARAEVAAARARGASVGRDCASEAAALAGTAVGH